MIQSKNSLKLTQTKTIVQTNIFLNKNPINQTNFRVIKKLAINHK